LCAGALLAPIAAHADKSVQPTSIQTNTTDPMAREAEPIRHHSGEAAQTRTVITPTGGEHRSLAGDDADYSVHGRTVDRTAVPSNAAATFRDAKNVRGSGTATNDQAITAEKDQRAKPERAQAARSTTTGRAWNASDKQSK
jgi:hypothetical protein